MILSEVLAKSEPNPDEMAFVIEQYILTRTGITVTVAPLPTKNEAILFFHAYTHSCEFFAHNRDKQ